MSRCDTKYPIMLVHGIGGDDRAGKRYWGRIPAALRDNGARVFFGGQDSNASAENNALKLKATALRMLKETGAEKLNIIVHSKGGLDSRYMISRLNMAERVASLTTLSTPHHGSETIDFLMKANGAMRLVGRAADAVYRLLGDENPDTYSCFKLFTTAGAERFNAEVPDAEGVFYQSFGFVNHRFRDPVEGFKSFVVKIVEGENDGMVTPSSAVWTNYQGVRTSSHREIVDMRGNKRRSAGEEAVITEFYVNLAEKLKENGF
ncbi:MAG: hypothetical protein J1F63_05320 [Oscillospiraceae bacterium]|nr:hypothetical protein [Oscillospiraceae bacterium]